MFNGTANQVFSPIFLNILLTWNSQDPVSTKEVLRNNASYIHQGNRNPYIDNNSYLTTIWGSPLSSDSFELSANINIFPNPTTGNKVTIQSDINLDTIELININGQVIERIEKPIFENNSFELNNLQTGFYFVKLSADNQSTTKKLIVN